MKLRWLNLVSMAAMAPMAVNVAPTRPDSSVTSLTFAAGSGDYAYVVRGCDNSVISAEKRHFRESGVELKHDFEGPPELGLRATILNEMPGYEDGTVVLNPFFSVEGTTLGIGLGFVNVQGDYHLQSEDYEIIPASGHLRIGKRSGYFSVHLNEDLPMTSGGGAMRTGAGFRAGKAADFWLGVGTLPFDQVGFVARADIHATRFLDLHAAGRLGSSQGINENAASVGVTLKLTRSHAK